MIHYKCRESVHAVLASLVIAAQLRCCHPAAAKLDALPPNSREVEAFWDSCLATTKLALGGVHASHATVVIWLHLATEF